MCLGPVQSTNTYLDGKFMRANHPELSLPFLPWHGACQCGAVRYEITGTPLTLYACHCTECRKQSASLHGLSLIVRRRDVSFTGETRVWSRSTDSGGITDCHFCADCGTRLYHQGAHSRGDDNISIKGGSLDQINRLEPVGHIWMKSAHPAFLPRPGTLRFDGQPKTYQPLYIAFSERYFLAKG